MVSEIRRLCKANKIPVYKLEEQTGISRNSISRWDQSIPSVDKVKKVADFFGVTVDSLLK